MRTPSHEPQRAPTSYLVGVTVIDRYWDILVFASADTPHEAQEQVKQQFAELRIVLPDGGSADGMAFEVTEATPLSEYVLGA